MRVKITDYLPSGYAACVFTQDGFLVTVGHREECEQIAIDLGALYCWIDRGRAIVRTDFAPDASTADSSAD